MDVRFKVLDWNNDVHWVDMNPYVTATVSGRRITITGNSPFRFPGGEYRVTPTSNLVCDGLLTTSSVPVPGFTYNFALLPDCDVDCTADTAPCNDPILCDTIDFNHDSLYPDTVDIDDFLSVFSGGPCSTGTCGDIDFNNDGLFPDTDDVDALINVFGGARASASIARPRRKPRPLPMRTLRTWSRTLSGPTTRPTTINPATVSPSAACTMCGC